MVPHSQRKWSWEHSNAVRVGKAWTYDTLFHQSCSLNLWGWVILHILSKRTRNLVQIRAGLQIFHDLSWNHDNLCFVITSRSCHSADDGGGGSCDWCDWCDWCSQLLPFFISWIPSVFRHIFKIQLCLMSDIKKLMNSWITQLQQPTKNLNGIAWHWLADSDRELWSLGGRKKGAVGRCRRYVRAPLHTSFCWLTDILDIKYQISIR